MARGTQLGTLVDMLRAEAGQSTIASLGADERPYLVQLLRRTQESLRDDFDWPFLNYRPVEATSAGQRYYDLPAGLDLEGVTEVYTWWCGQALKVERGITVKHYAVTNSLNDERSDPIRHWDLVWDADAGANYVEVWPVPETDNPRGLHYFGRRQLRPLVSNSDVADLDDQLIVLFAASEILAAQKRDDAPAKLRMAQARLANLRRRTKNGEAPIIVGGGADCDSYMPRRLRAVWRESN